MLNVVHDYRGTITGLYSQGTTSVFVTQHKEQQPTALYRLKTDSKLTSLSEAALPESITALAGHDNSVWLAGVSGTLYQTAIDNISLKTLTKLTFHPQKILGLAVLANQQLAVLTAQHVYIIDRQQQIIKQEFAFGEAARVVAASTDGLWLAIGHERGLVSVYTAEQGGEWALSADASLHQGEVTALAFAEHELQFYSAGADKKLLFTHARGQLQPVDKGRNSNHQQPIQAILLGHKRLFTAATDKTIKGWPYSGGQPLTQAAHLAAIRYLSLIHYQDQPALLAACVDNSWRIVGLNEDERFTEVSLHIDDGYASAKWMLSQSDLKEREQGIKLLAKYNDNAAFDLLAAHLKQEQDQTLREQVVKIAADSKHHKARSLLESALLDGKHASVRLFALDTLTKQLSHSDLYALFNKAIASPHADIGEKALTAAAQHAAHSKQAEQVLDKALEAASNPLRLLALHLLEQLYPDSPRASLKALAVQQPVLQRAALIRLYQRQFLQDQEVQIALARTQAAADAQLRHTAFLVSLLSRPALTAVVKALDADLARQLQELESFQLLAPVDALGEQAASKKPVSAKQLKQLKEALTASDYDLLVQTLSNRYTDLSLLAAFILALLQDERAFGALLIISQDRAEEIRAGVARAFARLGQAESSTVLALLLNDSAATVRDAAFSALLAVQADPLLSVQQGFASRHEDMHARSLKTLLDAINAEQDGISPAAQGLLVTALNDSFGAIRQETFKACLNRQQAGDVVATLDLLLSSQFADVHLEVLNEVKAQSRVLPAQDWVEAFLLALLNDEFAAVRKEALQFALQEKKRFALEKVLAAAVASRFSDVRSAAADYIEQNQSTTNQAYLLPLIKDSDESLRARAIKLVVQADDASSLLAALDSSYADVRLAAAAALARQKHPEAYDVLVKELTTRLEPEEAAAKTIWVAQTKQALHALSSLGDERGFHLAARFIEHKDPVLVEAAAASLARLARPEHISQLLVWQRDERPVVKIQASFALAMLGEASARQGLPDPRVVRQQLLSSQELAMSLMLDPVTPFYLQRYLSGQEPISIGATLALVSHELVLNSQAPVLSTQALSLNYPQVQLLFADLISVYSDPVARWQCVLNWLLRQQQDAHRSNAETRWQIDVERLQEEALMWVYGSGNLKSGLAFFYYRLKQDTTQAQQALAYHHFRQFYASEIAAALAHASALKVPDSKLQNQWDQRALGAYISLLRPGQMSASLKQQTLQSLVALAKRRPELKDSITHSLLPLLQSEDAVSRNSSLETLQTLAIDPAVLGRAASASLDNSVARFGLGLLLQSMADKQKMAYLAQLIHSDHPILAREAWALYVEAAGLVKAAQAALESPLLQLRLEALQAVTAKVEVTAEPAFFLAAAQNDYFPVAQAATLSIAKAQHPKALDCIKALYQQASQEGEYLRTIDQLLIIKADEAALWLIDLLEQQPRPRIVFAIYQLLVQKRAVVTFAPLLKRLSNDNDETKLVIKALLATTGFDQRIEYYVDESSDTSWLARQYPRHPDLFIELFKSLLQQNYLKQALALVRPLAWLKQPEAHTLLESLLPIVEGNDLIHVIEALAYRTQKRDGGVKGLLSLLTHRSMDVQFLAAEALALAGHGQGFSILLAAVDYQSNAAWRQRAVLALGQLGDERALDKLLSLADDSEHFLHTVALEAIGHLADSEGRERILRQLKARLQAAEYNTDLAISALNGLRWLNNSEAWLAIQQYIRLREPWSLPSHSHAVSLLKHYPEASSRELVLQILRHEASDESLLNTAYETARQLWPVEEAVGDYDYAALQNSLVAQVPSLAGRVVERVVTSAPTQQLFALLAADYQEYDESITARSTGTMRVRLSQALVSRSDVQEIDVTTALAAKQPFVVEVAARLSLRLAASENLKAALSQALNSYYTRWQHLQQDLRSDQTEELAATNASLVNTIKQLLWSLVQQHSQPDLLLQLLGTEKAEERDFQLQILQALLAVDGISEKALLNQLHYLQAATYAPAVALAQQLLAMYQAQASLDWSYFSAQPSVLLQERFSQQISQAAADPAAQAQVLPLLIAKQDTHTLFKLAEQVNASEALRLGAIEGLARITTPAAEQALQQLFKQVADKDIAKAAYRALRRWQRSQTKAQIPAMPTGALS